MVVIAAGAIAAATAIAATGGIAWCLAHAHHVLVDGVDVEGLGVLLEGVREAKLIRRLFRPDLRLANTLVGAYGREAWGGGRSVCVCVRACVRA